MLYSVLVTSSCCYMTLLLSLHFFCADLNTYKLSVLIHILHPFLNKPYHLFLETLFKRRSIKLTSVKSARRVKHESWEGAEILTVTVFLKLLWSLSLFIIFFFLNSSSCWGIKWKPFKEGFLTSQEQRKTWKHEPCMFCDYKANKKSHNSDFNKISQLLMQ